jgi:signal transduction histidine kinase
MGVRPNRNTGLSDPTATLAAAHARLVKGALAVYAGTAAIIITLLGLALVTDNRHEERQIEDQLLLATVERAHSLTRHLGLLVSELERLGVRSEVNLADDDLDPEHSLLKITHEQSTFFDVGVAILGRDGKVVSAVPSDFLERGASFGSEWWFSSARHTHKVRIVPVKPERKDSLLYVVSPIVRGDEFHGALLGAVDLSHRHFETTHNPDLASATTIIAARDGIVVYPPVPPAFAVDPAYRALFASAAAEPRSERTRIGGTDAVVAVAPISATNLALVMLSDQQALFKHARDRMLVRMCVGLLLTAVPFALLILLLRRSLRVFRKNEELAVAQERLRLLGEAANLIAHEVRNALNGLGVGLDVIIRMDRSGPDPERARIARQLRDEMQHLSDFTADLMLFSKGINPHPVRMDLAARVPEFTALASEAASELGCSVDIVVPETPVFVQADPALIRVVVSNLVGNAIDAVANKTGGAQGHVVVTVETSGPEARLRVADDGPGVAATVRPNLFEPFQTGKPSGVGIGLFLSRKIAMAHGGDLRLEPRTSGASFVLTLPVEGS